MKNDWMHNSTPTLTIFCFAKRLNASLVTLCFVRRKTDSVPSSNNRFTGPLATNRVNMSKHALIFWWQLVWVGAEWAISAKLNADTRHNHSRQGNLTILMAQFQTPSVGVLRGNNHRLF